MKFKKKCKSLITMMCLATTIGGGVTGVMLSNPSSVMAATNTKTITVDGTKVSVPVKGYKWLTVKGKTYFVVNGSLVKGWKTMDKSVGESTKHMSYFHPKTGALYTGWHQMSLLEGEKTVHWSYFGNNGWLRTGWQQMGKGTSNPDGNSAKHWSYFGNNGWLRTGWQIMGKNSANDFGENTTQHLSYFGSNGWLVSGKWQAYGNTYYWLKSDNGWAVDRKGELYPTNGRKTIIIGDSRTVNAVQAGTGQTLTTKIAGSPNYEGSVKKGVNEYYIAKFAQGYTWFVNTALPKAKKIGLNSNTDVIILMGVNDAHTLSIADKYANTINNTNWNGARVYYVSVNPSKDGKNIEGWNSRIKGKLKSSVKYIDTYNGIGKYTFVFNGDKWHYNAWTTRQVMNYVMTHR